MATSGAWVTSGQACACAVGRPDEGTRSWLRLLATSAVFKDASLTRCVTLDATSLPGQRPDPLDRHLLRTRSRSCRHCVHDLYAPGWTEREQLSGCAVGVALLGVGGQHPHRVQVRDIEGRFSSPLHQRAGDVTCASFGTNPLFLMIWRSCGSVTRLPGPSSRSAAAFCSDTVTD